MGYKHTYDTIYTHFQGITNNIYGFEDLFLLLHFLPVHPYFCPTQCPSIFVFTRPNDGWTGLYIKLCMTRTLVLSSFQNAGILCLFGLLTLNKITLYMFLLLQSCATHQSASFCRERHSLRHCMSPCLMNSMVKNSELTIINLVKCCVCLWYIML